MCDRGVVQLFMSLDVQVQLVFVGLSLAGSHLVVVIRVSFLCVEEFAFSWYVQRWFRVNRVV